MKEEGRTLIEYEDEDPEIRRRYQEERRSGIECQMPEEIYRPGASQEWHDPRFEALAAGGRE